MPPVFALFRVQIAKWRPTSCFTKAENFPASRRWSVKANYGINLFESGEGTKKNKRKKKRDSIVLSFVSTIEATSDKFSPLFFRFEAVDGTIGRDNRWVETRGRLLDKCRWKGNGEKSEGFFRVRLPLWMEGTVVPSVWSISPLRARFSPDFRPLFPDKQNFS